MSAAAGRAASKVGQAASKAGASAGNVSKKINEVGGKGSDNPVNKGAKRDPELYVYLSWPQSSYADILTSSEATVAMAEGSAPWQTEGRGGSGEDFKYQYHPGGDRSKPIKDAPSALNSVIVPNVTAPKVM
ncbi:uncharacterized protein KY384_001111 [Bacidia gigantensis]|uniref:uncharacterized protein n=1 Tax=Bacidia gigantensis TaxID=2732470 RepID=UPI001D05B7E8|nr:uncharacterized protein KY384_001111 [Bacidia gigantensis]KAG8534267.1 hypothetical protein KY384_001111 [Bacidia gigantensis]